MHIGVREEVATTSRSGVVCCPELFGPWLRTWAMFKTALVEICSLESRRCRADRSAYCMFLSGPSPTTATVHAQCGSGCVVIGPPNRLRPSSRFSHVSLSIRDDFKTSMDTYNTRHYLSCRLTSSHSGIMRVSLPRFPTVHQLPRSGGRLGPALSRTLLNPA